ncbi:MAG: hypothetical protein EBU46_20445, partial [Nitrosomonadaceae bacterium]|nr:hypothetical protein [Nitrosomonadaceae bacterium]
MQRNACAKDDNTKGEKKAILDSLIQPDGTQKTLVVAVQEIFGELEEKDNLIKALDIALQGFNGVGWQINIDNIYNAQSHVDMLVNDVLDNDVLDKKLLASNYLLRVMTLYRKACNFKVQDAYAYGLKSKPNPSKPPFNVSNAYCRARAFLLLASNNLQKLVDCVMKHVANLDDRTLITESFMKIIYEMYCQLLAGFYRLVKIIDILNGWLDDKNLTLDACKDLFVKARDHYEELQATMVYFGRSANQLVETGA